MSVNEGPASFKPGDEVEATIRGVVDDFAGVLYVRVSTDEFVALDALSDVRVVVKPREVGSWWKDANGRLLRWNDEYNPALPWWCTRCGGWMPKDHASFPLRRVVWQETGETEEQR